MTKDTLGDHAIVVFLQALAVTIWNMTDLKPEDRHRESFIRGFDGYLGEILAMAEKDGLDVRTKVNFLRNGLQTALDQMALVKAPTTGKPN
ncbi:MAG: hypothetical protein OXG35_31860 [Acidobacteria bacterium]|nr:hypothetical protein [Acidobacteriota bacterium]